MGECRLEAALSHGISKPKKARKYNFENPEIQRRASAIHLANHVFKPKTGTVRATLEAISISKKTWNVDERVGKISDAIISAARRDLGVED